MDTCVTSVRIENGWAIVNGTLGERRYQFYGASAAAMLYRGEWLAAKGISIML